MKIVTKFFFINTIFIITNIYAANQTIGADDAVGLPQLHTQLDGGNNKIANYALMDNGFSYLDKNATCSFASIFPVSGGIRLRGGTLNLNREFVFSHDTDLSTAGRVYGNGYNFIISEDVRNLSSLMSLNYVTSIDVERYLNTMAWSKADDGYVAVGLNNTSSGGASSVRIYYFNGSTITYRTQFLNGWPSIVKSMHWRPYGSFFVSDLKISLSGNEYNYAVVFAYNVGINSLTWPGIRTLGLNSNEVDAVTWHKYGDYIAVGRKNNSARVSVWEVSSTGVISSSSVNNTANANVPTTIDVARDALRWDPFGNYLIVGFNNTGDNLDELVLYYFDEQSPFMSSTLTYTVGVNIGADVTHMDWSSTGTFIAVAVDDGVIPSIRLYKHISSNGLFEEKIDARIEADEKIAFVSWSPDGKYLGVGRETGEDKEFNVYLFDKKNEKFYLVDEYDLGLTVSSVAWSSYDSYISQGGTDQSLNIYDFSAGRNFFTFNNTNLILDGDFSIDVPVKFSGNCGINGRGNRLFLDDDGQIIVVDGGQLKLKNMDLLGLKGKNLSCEQNNSSLTIENSKLRLLGDWEFDTGTILFSSDVFLSGTNKFIYSSRFSSTIDSNSMLYLSPEMTFNYAPKTNKRDLLHMTDETSWLYFNKSSLISTSTGMRLTRGTLLLDNDVTFSCAGQFSSEAICLGNGNVNNDLTIYVLSGAHLEIYGAFEYENSN